MWAPAPRAPEVDLLLPLLVLVGLTAAVLARELVVCRRPACRRRQLEQLSLPARLPVDEGDGVPGGLRTRLGARPARREIGVAVVAARDALTGPRVPGPRRAWSRAVGLPDHVPGLPLLCARLLCALPVAAVVVVLLRSALLGTPVVGRGGTPVPVLVAVVVCGWASTEVAARRFLTLSQPAGSPVELAWDDVLRTGTVRRLAYLPTYLAGTSLVLLLTRGAGEPGSTSDLWSTVALLVAGALVAGVFVPGRPGEVDDPAPAP